MRPAASAARPRAGSSLSHGDTPETRYEAHDGAAAHKQDELLALAAGEPPHAARKRFLCWSLTRRQWRVAVCASVGLVVALVVLLVVFLAVAPAIFQKYVDKVQLRVNYMDIKTLPTDASRNEIDVELSLRVTYDASVSASMEDAAATLLYGGKPFGAVTLPAQQFAKGADSFDLVVRNVAEISDTTVFRALSRALVTDEQVTIDTRATVTARAMGLSYGGLKLDRAFSIKAFDNFRDPKPRVNNITLAACAGAAYKLLINATLDNDAQAGIGGIGALNLSVYHEQNYLGQAISTDASLGLPRGPTDMVLELTVVKTPKLLAAMLGMVGGMLGPSGVQFYVRGDHANATRAPLLDEAFRALNISMLYTDGLSKLTVSPTCNLMAILSGGR